MSFNPRYNYGKSLKESGWIPRREAKQQDYDRIGFMSGLEVHQQLLTKEKMFCHCPAGIFNHSDDFDAEIIRHMRPTLSELGEYDGTALMEFRTRKEIVYRIKNETACTYEVDDTPPFPLNSEALGIAIEISLLSKLNIVGEVHITRKQYLDGSIPTGFQRTAIIGVEGELAMPKKKIRLIQLSIEEDSCREISDIGHRRIYKTDRLGMPLIETVTYPDFVNPDEVMEGCDYIRFLNRSTGKVRTGMGAGRQDVNVSCRGGSRVEIKGVAHTKWIPELTHNEVFRQWSLLRMRDFLLEKGIDKNNWKASNCEITGNLDFSKELLKTASGKGIKLIAVNLPAFEGCLSWFTQPGKTFKNEISDRLKVIACLEKPNCITSEEIDNPLDDNDLSNVREQLFAKEGDAQLIFAAAAEDIDTALETIEERCIMALEGIPEETRKSLSDGTTIFERVLPGADRMYPDTDTAPIPLEDDYIKKLESQLPEDIIDRYNKLKDWGVPEDVYTYIFSKNLFPLMEEIIGKTGVKPSYLGTFLGHELKFAEGQSKNEGEFNYRILLRLFEFLKEQNYDFALAEVMLKDLMEHPKMEFESILANLKHKKIPREEILARIPFLKQKFAEGKTEIDELKQRNWIMGQLKGQAIGNIDLQELSKEI
ncbi:MAG: Glu-tRNA(Gln) amidotransferase subunit GatE [Chlorobi bacterium]|nr:Glu-tRNA(Gln) amidotransferase subunit GatE [Chlorobiota bacterium]